MSHAALDVATDGNKADSIKAKAKVKPQNHGLSVSTYISVQA